MPPINLSPEEEKEWAALQEAEASGKTIEAPAATEQPPAEKAEQTDTKVEPAQATETPQQSPDDDPYAGLSPKMRDYIVGLETNNKMLSGRLSKVEGHIGSLKQQLDAAKAARSAGADAPSDAQIRRAAGDPKKFEALKDEYPEFAEAIEGYLNSALESVQPGEKVDISKLRDDLAGEFDSRLNRKFEELRVETHHRGWQKTTTSPEFVGWVQRQPREVQVLYTSPNSDDVIRLLDLYSEAKKVVTKQEDRLSSAAALNTNSPAPSRQKSWDDMTQEEQWNYLAQQDAAAKR